jgi:drug/metabolite transporter (DMT)-like permease
MNHPLLLLLGTGTMLGLNFPIGKLALAAGIGAALWAATISLGAGLAMWIVTSLTEKPTAASLGSDPSPTPARIRLRQGFAGQEREGFRAALVRYAFISGFLSYVMPNLLTFSAIPKIGSGLAAIMFALSPVTTAALSILFKVRPPNLLGVVGIALGLIGALVIIVFRGSSFAVGDTWWLGVALLIPVFLGIGNLYRTLAWPEGASPRRLAATTNLAAVAPLLVIAVFESGTLDLAPLLKSPGLVALQVAVSSAMFLMFFRLQQIGGPTYLSQIGYVAAAVGVVIGVGWLNESYPLGIWAGTGIVAGGIALATFAQFRRA